VRPYLKNNQQKKGWRSDSSGRAPAQQVSGPELKCQYHMPLSPQKKTTTKRREFIIDSKALNFR
jgi:hypothetical protein